MDRRGLILLKGILIFSVSGECMEMIATTLEYHVAIRASTTKELRGRRGTTLLHTTKIGIIIIINYIYYICFIVYLGVRFSHIVFQKVLFSKQAFINRRLYTTAYLLHTFG